MATLLVLLVLVVTSASAEDLVSETCDSTKTSTNIVPTNANAVIGGLFGMRQPGSDGYGCGLPAPGENIILLQINNNNVMN